MKKKNMILLLCFLLIWLTGGLSIFPDGFIIVKKYTVPDFRPFPLSVKYHHVNVRIVDNVAVTKIDQAFFNPTRRRLEGFYMFPVPDGAVIRKFSMFINGKETPAELLDAKKARKIYEDIVRRMKDPALLEYSGKSMFRVRIFPIEPMSEKRIKISYSEVLKRDGRTVEYIYPLNTEKFSSVPIKDVSVRAEIITTGDIGNIYCPTHRTEIIRKTGRRTMVGFEASNVKPDRDFKLYFDYGKNSMNFSLKTFRKEGGDGFFFLNITPSFTIKQSKIIPKNIVFVLDVSGSMAGKKIEQAKRALKFCINNLRNRDRFNVLKFSTETESLFNSSVIADKNNISKAIRFVDDLRAIGGTNIFEALEMALSGRDKDTGPGTIIFITDGKPTIGITVEKELIKKIEKMNISETKIFTFGIGNDINTHLLDKLTSITGAYRSYIGPDEDIEVKISGFFTKIESPILTDLSLKVDSPIKIKMVYPKKIPDLFKGSSISLIGRYAGNGTVGIRLKGKIINHSRNFDFKGIFRGKSMSADYIPKLWAARRIGFLLDQIRLNGEDIELKNEIIRIARKYGIVTPYTSYLIVEDEKRSIARHEISESDQLLTPSVAPGKKFEEAAEKANSSLKMKSGSVSIRASKEVQRMYSASDYSQVNQGGERVLFRNKGNIIKKMGSIVKNLDGRAFYNNGSFWVDSLISLKKGIKKVNVKFSSNAYFDLLFQYPGIAKFFSLGKNVRFIYKNVLYEVTD